MGSNENSFQMQIQTTNKYKTEKSFQKNTQIVILFYFILFYFIDIIFLFYFNKRKRKMYLEMMNQKTCKKINGSGKE